MTMLKARFPAQYEEWCCVVKEVWLSRGSWWGLWWGHGLTSEESSDALEHSVVSKEDSESNLVVLPARLRILKFDIFIAIPMPRGSRNRTGDVTL